ncbi:hypothetical protein QCA50_003621 [Cerrena zonata]|uniref:Mitochondrial import inner membrane translocase subunit TIM54 n=1 Tax=Cerrena zonata TaxID=2478898 RepID=A0AAW0GWR0_9APHY
MVFMSATVQPLSLMSTSPHGGDSKFPVPEPRLSGVKAALRYTGIPPSWLDKRPSIPSRNWLIFIGVTSTITGWYIYDRRQCKNIRQEYVDKVKHLSEVPLHSLDYPRKVTVYGSKWPGDEDSDRSLRYFRKYVKPVLVAAAVDFEMIKGRRHGELADRIANEIRARRRIDLGIDPPPPSVMLLHNTNMEAKRKRELEGGIVIVGRSTFKEFMNGLKRGWTEGLDKVDKEEKLSRELETDGRFDEPVEPEMTVDVGSLDGEPLPTPSKLPPSRNGFSPFSAPHLRPQTSTADPRTSTENSIPSNLNTPPEKIAPVPPILLVNYVNHIGLAQIPNMIWEFFNERHKVRSGAEAAYKLISNETRPFVGPSNPAREFVADDQTTSPAKPFPSEIQPDPTDLDFGKDAEAWYKNSTVKNFASDIQKARDEYYKELPKKLETARALARGVREPTKDEVNYPPPTEVEIRAERMKKELRWRSDEAGWEVIKPEREADWDDRFDGVLKVFVEPSS